MTATAPSGQRAGDRLAFVADAVAAAAALGAAGRLGVLARLDNGPVDPAGLAAACAITERGAHVLLAALAGMGLVETGEDGDWRAALPDLAGLTGWSELWDHLDETLRNGQPAVPGDTPAGAGRLYPAAVGYLGPLFAAAAQRAASYLPAGPRVLDVGAGAAPWSLAVAARDPACQVTAVDLPAVLTTTRRVVTDAGRNAQFRYVAGDLFSAELDQGGYDLVIAGNLCHLFDEAANRRLLARLTGALRPGGTLAIMDVIPDERPASRSIVLYELGLLLRTTHGRVYPLATYLRWLADAGLTFVERSHLSHQVPVTLLVTRRPAETSRASTSYPGRVPPPPGA